LIRCSTVALESRIGLVRVIHVALAGHTLAEIELALGSQQQTCP
jgi:hypothetical protein